MKEEIKGRLNLNESATESLGKMLSDLKNTKQHLLINSSKLCSWIVERYSQMYYESERARIIDAHFNPKRFLLEALKSAKSDDAVKVAFQEAMTHLNPNKSRGFGSRKKVEPKNEQNEKLD